jgi:hypothetical protein
MPNGWDYPPTRRDTVKDREDETVLWTAPRLQFFYDPGGRPPLRIDMRFAAPARSFRQPAAPFPEVRKSGYCVCEKFQL